MTLCFEECLKNILDTSTSGGDVAPNTSPFPSFPTRTRTPGHPIHKWKVQGVSWSWAKNLE